MIVTNKSCCRPPTVTDRSLMKPDESETWFILLKYSEFIVHAHEWRQLKVHIM